jgi:hypothetical protein
MKRKPKQSNQVASNDTIAQSWFAQQEEFTSYYLKKIGVRISYDSASHCLKLSFPSRQDAEDLARARYYFNELGFNISIVHAGQQIAQFRVDDVLPYTNAQRWVEECADEPCQWFVVEGEIVVCCSSNSDASHLWRSMDWSGRQPKVEGKHVSIWAKGRLYATSFGVLNGRLQ